MTVFPLLTAGNQRVWQGIDSNLPGLPRTVEPPNRISPWPTFSQLGWSSRSDTSTRNLCLLPFSANVLRSVPTSIPFLRSEGSRRPGMMWYWSSAWRGETSSVGSFGTGAGRITPLAPASSASASTQKSGKEGTPCPPHRPNMSSTSSVGARIVHTSEADPPTYVVDRLAERSKETKRVAFRESRTFSAELSRVKFSGKRSEGRIWMTPAMNQHRSGIAVVITVRRKDIHSFR